MQMRRLLNGGRLVRLFPEPDMSQAQVANMLCNNTYNQSTTQLAVYRLPDAFESVGVPQQSGHYMLNTSEGLVSSLGPLMIGHCSSTHRMGSRTKAKGFMKDIRE